jgi:integrase
MYQLKQISSTPSDVWNMLSMVTIEEGVEAFLTTLKCHTKRSYRTCFKNIFQIWEEGNLISRKSSLQVFAQSNLENLLDFIHQRIPGSISTKQHRCAAFISLTKYLCRVTGRLIPVAIPKSGIDATFQKIRTKATTKALNLEEWHKFSNELKKLSYREYLIAKAIFQGAKRCSEVLESKIENIDWEKNAIMYKQMKSHILESSTYIYYSKEYMDELKQYLGSRTTGYIFVTRNGRLISQNTLYRSFAYASNMAKMRMRVHPHMLRASAITSLIKMGYHSDQIMQISGHTNPVMVLYYDKTPIEENISKDIKLC